MVQNRGQRPIRVLRVITRLNAGGPSRHVVWLARGLAPFGYETLLAAGTLAPGEDDLSAFAAAQGVPVRKLASLQRDIDPLRDWRCFRDVVGLLREYEPDLVHTHHSKAGFLVRSAARLVNRERRQKGKNLIRTVHTFHGNMISRHFSPMKARLFGSLERFVSHRLTDAVIVLSAEQRLELVESVRFAPAEKVFIVPNALDLSEYEETGLRGRFRRELGIPEEAFLVGMIGRIAPQKHHEMFLEVAGEVRKQLPHAHFVVVGGGSGEERLKALAAKMGIAASVRFTGVRTDLASIYRDLDTVALTSRNEGTPLSLIEAMAAGRAIVATDVGGVRDLLTREARGDVFTRTFVGSEEPRGQLVPSGDTRAFAEALLSLEREPDLRDGLGSAGRAYAFRHHGLPRLFADLDSMYRRLLEFRETTRT